MTRDRKNLLERIVGLGKTAAREPILTGKRTETDALNEFEMPQILVKPKRAFALQTHFADEVKRNAATQTVDECFGQIVFPAQRQEKIIALWLEHGLHELNLGRVGRSRAWHKCRDRSGGGSGAKLAASDSHTEISVSAKVNRRIRRAARR